MQFQAEVDEWDRRIALAKLKGDETVTLEEGRAIALANLRENDLQNALAAEADKWDPIIAEAKAGNLEVEELEAKKNALMAILRQESADAAVEDEEQLNARRKAVFIKGLEDFASVANAFASLTQAMSQAAAAKTAQLERLADEDGVRTEEEKNRIEASKKRQRDLALTTIALQTAAAIAQGIASAMSLPWPENLVAAASAVAQVVALMAQASSAMDSVDSSSSAPPAQTGGGTPDNVPLGADGVPALPGRSHSEGGMNIVDPASGRVVYNVEGGEAVVNKEVTRQNPRVITALMSAAKRSDKRLYMSDFEGGNGPLTSPLRAVNTAVASSAMQIVHMAGGGVISHKNSTIKFTKGQGAADGSGHQNSTVRFRKGQGAADPSGGGNDGTNALLAQLLKAIDRQTALVEQDIQAPRPAIMQLGPATDKTEAAWQRLKNSNTLRRA